MTKAETRTLEHLLTLMETQTARITALSGELEIQFKRMAQMQAELDGLPQARERRERERARFHLPLPMRPTNGNGRSAR